MTDSLDNTSYDKEISEALNSINDNMRKLRDELKQMDDFQKQEIKQIKDLYKIKCDKFYERSVYLANKGSYGSTEMVMSAGKEKDDYALECAKYAMENMTSNMSRAKHIKSQFEAKYGGVWNCSILLNAKYAYSVQKSNYISFEIGEFLVILFQS